MKPILYLALAITLPAGAEAATRYQLRITNGGAMPISPVAVYVTDSDESLSPLGAAATPGFVKHCQTGNPDLRMQELNAHRDVHSAYANKSYLAIHTPTELPATDQERLERECSRFGIGLMTFDDPTNWETYEVLIEPAFQTPDPELTDAFISIQLADENKDKLHAWIR